MLDTDRTGRELFLHCIIRPTKVLFLSPIVFLLSLYVGLVYGYLYLLFTTITIVFEQNYGFSQGSVVLSYFGLGIVSIVGLLLLGGTSDRLLTYLSAKNGREKKTRVLSPTDDSWIFVYSSFIVHL